MLAPPLDGLTLARGDDAPTALAKFFEATHYNPNPTWGWTSRAQANTVRAMIPYSVLDMVREMAAVTVAPFVLAACTVTLTRTSNLLGVLQTLTAHNQDLGMVCQPAAAALGLDLARVDSYGADLLGVGAGAWPLDTPTSATPSSSFHPESMEAQWLEAKVQAAAASFRQETQRVIGA